MVRGRSGHELGQNVPPVKRGEIWFAETGSGGDRPVLILTRDLVADRIDRVVVAQVTTTIRGLLSELPLDESDGLRHNCVVTFDNINTVPRTAFRRRVSSLSTDRLRQAGDVLNEALGCPP